MAEHGLSIAKASLLAACLRPDVTKLNRNDLNHFHDSLQLSITKCTPSNIQNTKNWLLEHILPSPTRSLAFGKYLLSTSKYLDENKATAAAVQAWRQQLHILYILNDVLHHVKHHSQSAILRNNFVDGTQPGLDALFRYPASERKSRTTKRLHDLLQIWEKEKYFGDDTIAQLRRSLASDTAVKPVPQNAVLESSRRELSWIMPATHGDPSSPFFDLPAANLMPHIVPNSTTPIRPERIRALHLSSGPADESLVNAVKDFLKDVSSIEEPYKVLEEDGMPAEMDELGQLSYRNEAGDLVGDTYYGWSRAFCDKMKKRGPEVQVDRRGRSRSYSSEGSRSWNSHKRRKYSTSRSRSRSYSRSLSPRHDIQHRSDIFNANQRAHAVPYTAEPVTRQSASQAAYAIQARNGLPQNVFHPPPPGGQGFPIPPPRPANWAGPWPPPPPPPPPNGPGFSGFGTQPFPPMPPNMTDQIRRTPNQNDQNFGRR